MTDDPADEAWRLYRERGVVMPEYGDEIAERKALMREWAAIGRPLA